MKEYNRTTRKWEEKTTGEGKFTTRKECKGGRAHEFVVSLPSWVKVTDNIVPEAIEEYYRSEQRRADFEHKEDKLLSSLGIYSHRWSPEKISRHMRCIVCNKREYE